MKRLNFYIAGTLFRSTLLGIGILTFVMMVGSLFKAADLISRGVGVSLIAKYIGYVLPHALQFTLPLAILCATVLVFSRLSADNEISAMRASGISLWQIVSPGLLLAALLSGLCFSLQLETAAECRYRAHNLRSGDTIKNPLAFVEPGRYVHFPGHIIYLGSRHENQIGDVQIYRLNKQDEIEEDISSPGGTVEYDEQSAILTLKLDDAIIYTVERGEDQRARERHTAGNLTYRLDTDEMDRIGSLARKPKYMSMHRILSTIYIHNKAGEQTTPLYLELHKRLALAFSPVGFFMIGIPFGIKTRRSESSIGIVISLILAMFFYVFLALAESLQAEARYHPEVLVWIPNILYQLGGLYAIRRIARR
ncbi:MAG: LptF/LptG family permease [Lentisphaeria bacterium]